MAVWLYQQATTSSRFSSEEQGIAICAAAMGLLVIVSASITVFGTKEPERHTPTQKGRKTKLKFKDAFLITVRNRPFLTLVLCAFAYGMTYYFYPIYTPYLIIYGIFDGDRGEFATLLFQSTLVVTGFAVVLNFMIRRWASAPAI